MSKSVTPMIHVPDVKAAAEWHQAIGFEIVGFNDCGEGVWNWARLAFGDGEIMFNEGGRPSAEPRREVDLYLQVEDVDGLHERLKDRVVVFEGPHDTEYGMREFIIRDLNRFWITFGQPIA